MYVTKYKFLLSSEKFYIVQPIPIIGSHPSPFLFTLFTMFYLCPNKVTLLQGLSLFCSLWKVPRFLHGLLPHFTEVSAHIISRHSLNQYLFPHSSPTYSTSILSVAPKLALQSFSYLLSLFLPSV